MATTSSTLATGTATAGRGGKGKGRAAVLAVAALLGVGLLASGIPDHPRPAVFPATSIAAITPAGDDVRAGTMGDSREDRRTGAAARPTAITGETPCPLGGTAPCGTHAAPQPPVIAGETPCPLGGTAPCGVYSLPADARRSFVPEQFTDREDRRAYP